MEADAPSLDALARLAAECLATADRGPFILRVDRARDCAALVDGSGESCIADVHDAEGSAPLLAASWSLARGLVAAVDALRAERAQRDALAAAVREERAAREAVPEGFDADHAGADERARVYALWDAVEAVQKHLDALLSGTDADAAGGE